MPISLCENKRGNGFAKDAIMLGLESAKKLGFTRLVDHVREDNIASIVTYRSCGAQMTKEYVNKYIPALGKEVKMYKFYVYL